MKYVRNKKILSTKQLAIRILLIMFGLGVLLVLGTLIWYQQQLKPVTAQSQQVLISIEKGESASEIAADLEANKVIRNSTAFLWYLRMNNLRDDIQAGRYQLDSALSAPKIADAITKGEVQTDLFTILPGERLDQTRAAFIKAGFSAQEVDAALNPANYVNHPALAGKPSSASLEGYLFPDSYQRTSSTTVAQIVRQSLDEMADALTPDIIEGFKAQGLTTHEGITLASIVVKEVNNLPDKQKVAGVFLNRLAADMPLGSDVTYQYIADITGQERSAAIDSPYNTRKYKGLPPGPISSVNKDALVAVSNPAKSDYLFFVAGDDGKIYYSKTLNQHEEYVRLHCKKLCSVY
jgi:UPF0755 protein